MTKVYRDGFYAPSNEGIGIVSPEGATVAEYFPDEKILVFLYDAVHFDSNCSQAAEVLEMALTDFVNVAYTGNGKRLTKEEIAERRRKVQEEAKRKAILDFLTRADAKAKEQAVQQLENTRSRIKECNDQLKRLYRDEARLVVSSAFEAKNADEVIKNAEAQFAKIRDVKSIKDYELQSDKIVFETDTIYAEVNDSRYLIGRFKIKVNPQNADIIFENIDQKNRRRSYWGDNCHAPHVGYDGHACLGNSSETLSTLIRQGEWCAVADILVGFLESVNTADPAGRFYVNWDKVDADGKVLAGGANTAHPEEEIECHHCGKMLRRGRDTIHECHDCGEYVCGDCVTYIGGEDYNVCKDCYSESDYAECVVCGDLYNIDNSLFKCPDCGRYVCTEDAVMDRNGNFLCCPNCKDKHPEPEEEIHEGTVKCEICGNYVTPDHLYTCEHCGTQGCSDCIRQGNDGIFACEEHRR
jgi:hypothetical protein